MNCAEGEYYLHGECHRCQQCPPGQELKQECGYGVGVSAVGVSTVCVQCEERWFKGEWGSHSCRMCQTCRRLNRKEVTPCTRTHNAACGNCLPGFYSKRRLDGLQDWECLPCGPAPFRNTQCRSEGGELGNVWSSEAPPHNVAVMTTACVAAVAMVTFLFVIVVLMYKGFSSFRNMFRGCLSSPGLGHRDLAASSVSTATEHRVTQSADVEASESCLESSTCPGFVSMATTPSPCPAHCTASESLRLQSSSNCSDTSGVVSQAAGSPDIPSGLSWSMSSYDLTSRGRHCAVEQESAWGYHAPIECSELDLKTSLSLDLQASTQTEDGLPSTTHSVQCGERETGGGGGGEKGGMKDGESVGERRSSCGDAAAARSVTLILVPATPAPANQPLPTSLIGWIRCISLG
ncbi:tumor necrosis factor receptor superfamily member 27 isoform X1 [Pygocentrus nattereri]|uniref:TNFR-Cys domain-containing protein n=1 Tax=Pygocentrus nattereri TaxID=42514 RepID=A0A3B4BRC3_PYGNA|nr:tumor necrosis factor receptor superfamily member 27 isoform X1 [Pygocentrus nattereri]